MRRTINFIWDTWANWHPLLRFLIVGTLLVLAVFYGFKPTRNALVHWRNDQKIASASVALKENRKAEAKDLAMSVILSGELRIEAFRIVEEAMQGQIEPRLFQIAQALLNSPQGTDADKLKGLKIIAPNRPMGIVMSTWFNLPEKNRKQPEFMTIMADRLFDEGMFVQAATLLKSCPISPTPSNIQQRLIKLTILDGGNEAYQQAQQWIVEGRDGFGFDETMELLESIPSTSLNVEILNPIIEELREEKEARLARASLFLARIEINTNFPERSAIIDQAVARWKSDEPELLTKFLLDLGLHQRVSDEVSLADLTNHPALLAPLIKTYQETKEWEKLNALLDQEAARMARYEFFFYKSLIAGKNGNAGLYVQNWKTAMEEAKSSSVQNANLDLAKLAAKAGLTDKSENAMVAAIRLAQGPLPLYDHLMPLLNSLFRQNRENDIMMISSIYFAFEPGNIKLISQYSYLAGVNNLINPDTLLRVMKPIADERRNIVEVQFVLVTLQLCANRPLEAEETLSKINFDANSLSPTQQAAYLVTQLMNGKMKSSDTRITRFHWESLMVSEQKKYSQLIRQVAKTEATEAK